VSTQLLATDYAAGGGEDGALAMFSLKPKA
jgi:hypothetical protein